MQLRRLYAVQHDSEPTSTQDRFPDGPKKDRCLFRLQNNSSELCTNVVGLRVARLCSLLQSEICTTSLCGRVAERSKALD